MSALICFTYLEVFESMTVEKTTNFQLKWIFKFLQWIRKNWAKLLPLYSEASIEKANKQGEVLLLIYFRAILTKWCNYSGKGSGWGPKPLPSIVVAFFTWQKISSFFIKFTEAKKLPRTPIVVHLVVLEEISGLPIMRRIKRHKTCKPYLLLFKTTVLTLSFNWSLCHVRLNSHQKAWR